MSQYKSVDGNLEICVEISAGWILDWLPSLEKVQSASSAAQALLKLQEILTEQQRKFIHPFSLRLFSLNRETENAAVSTHNAPPLISIQVKAPSQALEAEVPWYVPILTLVHSGGFEPLDVISAPESSPDALPLEAQWEIPWENNLESRDFALILMPSRPRVNFDAEISRLTEGLKDDLIEAELYSYGSYPSDPQEKEQFRSWQPSTLGPIGGQMQQPVEPEGYRDWYRVPSKKEEMLATSPNHEFLVRSEANPQRPDNEAENAIVSSPTPRYLVGRMTNQARVGEVIALQVWVALSTAGTKGIAMAGFTSADGGEVMLDLYCPNFTVHSPLTQRVTMEPGQESNRVRFEVVAATPGKYTVEVSAWRSSVHLGTLAMDVSISTRDVRSVEPVERTSLLSSRQATPGEVTLDLQYNPVTNRYRFQLRGDTIGISAPMEAEPLLDGGRTSKLAQVVAFMNAFARGSNNYDAPETRAALEGAGAFMWRDMLPESIKALLLKNLDSIQRLNIISPGDPLPWEMMLPFGDGLQPDAFLAERMTIARWTYGVPAPPLLKRGPLCCVLPDDAPHSASAEVEQVQTIWGENDTARTLGDVIQHFKDADFGLMHFATHNISPDNSLVSAAIPMGSLELTPMFLGPQYAGRFTKNAPLVFLNACESNTMAAAYTQLSGWANCFLEAGAGAFVGSLWEIRDDSAFKFSKAFHEALKSGGSLGQAMKAGREVLGGKNGDPTWLAYTLYGDPDAVVASGND